MVKDDYISESERELLNIIRGKRKLKENEDNEHDDDDDLNE